MRYLFFDIECSDGFHMCEFGYVITDTFFNVLEKNIYVMNPEARFTLSLGKSGIKLYYKDQDYKKAPTFKSFYNDIKDLITYNNQLIIGHSISNDANFLNIACEKYGLEYIDFKFLDTQKLFSDLFDYSRQISLEEAQYRLNVETDTILHRSDEDSLLTMELLKKMLDKSEETLDSCVSSLESFKGSNENGKARYNSSNQMGFDELINFCKKKNKVNKQSKKLLLSYENNITFDKYIDNELSNKKVCITDIFEQNHFIETIALIYYLKKCNAKYVYSPGKAKIFIDYNNESLMNKGIKNENLENLIRKNKKIKIYTLNELLNILNITMDDLSSFPFPSKEELIYDFTNDTNEENASYSLSDIFKDIVVDD